MIKTTNKIKAKMPDSLFLIITIFIISAAKFVIHDETNENMGHEYITFYIKKKRPTIPSEAHYFVHLKQRPNAACV